MSKNDGISGLVDDKLDKNNFHAWKFRMTNFLMGKGYWDYIDGNQEDMPDLPDVNPTAEQIKVFKDWNQGARKVMYWLSTSVQNTMIGHIQDATSLKQAWYKLVSIDTTNTKARKIQLENELNTVKNENLSINDYTLKIKDLVPMLIAKEKNLGEDSSSSQGRNNYEQVFYSNRGRGRGRGAGQGRGRGRGNQNQETGDDTAHPIAHIGNVPLSLQDGNVKYLADVLHVPNITKNLVSVG
ncbi:hypothetical protein L7F22_007520 [Adiantum nelumboides]|nr:hypothetical protein [Adiantum nelumboides]